MLRNIQNNKKLLNISTHIATLCTHRRAQWKPHLGRNAENRGIEMYFITMVHDTPSSNCELDYLTFKMLESSGKIKRLLNHFIFLLHSAFLSPIILTTDYVWHHYSVGERNRVLHNLFALYTEFHSNTSTNSKFIKKLQVANHSCQWSFTFNPQKAP
jgi:hypothetical protein